MVGFVIFIVVAMAIAVIGMIVGTIRDIKDCENPVGKIFASIGLVATIITAICYLCDDSI